MIDAEWIYWALGLFFCTMAVFALSHRENPRRTGAFAFWALLGMSFCYSTFVTNKTAAAWPLGLAVLAVGVLGGTGALGKSEIPTSSVEEREAAAERLGNRLFAPALLIPLVALLFATLVASVKVNGKALLANGTPALTGLGAGVIVALIAAMALLRPAGRPSLGLALREGSRLAQAIGWALLLPQYIAILGLLFDKAGVGKQVGRLFSNILPDGSQFAAVVLYCVGMAVFTVVMGNGFAAFPVMTAAIGWPVLVTQFHGNPAVIFAVGMLSGFCGTLCTPMAANFNIVPAVLLEMKDRYGPIKAQLPTAIPLLACNIAIMYVWGF
ncbi:MULTISPECIES: DUF979 domain-containing protein [unclassified Nocardia]|uniref:DUF979 domain-containing protein n=1 Tax=unclassified Nocardia TaxID=2637762 RepID=UPI001CE489B6|nr:MULTISPECIES: DUF979 domain-containing protein [unclassified Nocardia]